MKFPFFLPLALLTTSALAAPLVKQTVATGLNDPMEIAIAPNGDFYVIEREGRLLRINPNTGGIFVIGCINVHALRSTDPKSPIGREDGLLGIALDPAFLTNQHIFLYYSAADKFETRLSRFTLNDGKIDSASELQLLIIPTERDQTATHQAGSLKFDPDGLLYLSTGDNTNPFASAGVAPIDDREGKQCFDAQRSAGNTNDLRGKILRIKPTKTGYEIPKGNLFPKGTAKTRPEIYVMGCRNPFRISIDPKTKTLYWGEVGPDGQADGPKGPRGHDEVNQAKAAGNFGWPFVIANNKPYPIVDFSNNAIGQMTDPNSPKNPGKRNTGLTDLPPAQPAFIWYPYAESTEFPIIGKGGRNAMAGPVFYHEADRKFNILSKEDNKTLLNYDWMRGKIFKTKLTEDEKFEKMEILMEKLVHPMDLEMNKDGSLVLLEYGSDWYFNKNGSLSQLLPDNGNKPPTISIKATPEVANAYSVDKANDPEGKPMVVSWYVTEDTTERNLGTGSNIVLPAGNFQEVRAVAKDENGAIAIARISLTHASELKSLKLELGKTTQKPTFGDKLKYKVTAEQNPDPKQLSIRARYIPPTGHDSGGPKFEPEPAELAKANQCLACHQVDTTSVGPAYFDVAIKYRDQKDAKDYLVNKLKTGGSGVWGVVPMPPQAALKADDADRLVTAILKLANGANEVAGNLEGEITLPPKFDTEPGGAWEISAEAAGYSPSRIRIPAK
jgi:cytochrome c